ncbi:outer membrane protein assembly factor BamB family protein [Kitasatospora sp. NPDC002543]
MQSPSSEGSAHGASWQWDEGTDGGEASEDVVAGGGERPRPSRRQLLLGAGVIAAGGAAWAAFGRSGGGTARPAPGPTSLSGPTPLWTYRGPAAMTPERIATGLPSRPLYLSRNGLQVLDHTTGAPGRLLVFDPPSARSLPGGSEALDPVVLGPEHLFTTYQGHVEARHFTDSAADWSLPLPDELQEQTRLAGFDPHDPGVLYGCSWGRPKSDGRLPAHYLFALRVTDRTLLWSVRTEEQELPVTPATRTGFTHHLACLRVVAGRTELAVRDAATGREVWTAPGEEGLRWCVSGYNSFLVPDGKGGVRELSTAGKPAWSHSPAPGESRRALAPIVDGPQLYIPWDEGLITCHDTSSDTVLWSCRLPFPLDRRNRVLLGDKTLFVPGTADAGVCAVYTSTGELGWTFRDSGPARGPWTVASGWGRLYAGHDDVLHALPL